VPTRAACLTRAGPQPCAAASLGNLDSNQDKRGRLPVQSRACCQLHHSPSRARGGNRTHIRQFLRLAALPVGCTRALYAARESNPDLAD
jgi:hypothetical protein